MRAASARVMTVALLGALATGCIPLPVPTFATAPRFSEQQVAEVGSQPQTRDSLESSLGPADLHRANGRIWIYTWTEDFGAWELVPIHGDWSDNRAGPVESHRFLWVFEFDDAGNAMNQEFVRDAKQSHREAFCSNGGVCIHRHFNEDDAEFGYRQYFQDQRSAVSVRGEARVRLTAPEPRRDQCVVLLWPDAEWDSVPGYPENSFGVAFRVEGSPPWSEWRWLPRGAFARLILPAGEHPISILDRSKDEDDRQHARSSTRTFTCNAGEQLYLMLGGSNKAYHHFPLELRPVASTEAQAIVGGMSELLPPD